MVNAKLQLLFASYISYAKNILNNYNGTEPFSNFLKKYFSSRKKFGARDRRYIIDICYSYYRMGKAAGEINRENLLKALFLSHPVTNEIVHYYKPEWDEWSTKTIKEKAAFINFDYQNIFPYQQDLSEKINHLKFCASFLVQPKLFLRLRPLKKNYVINKLQTAKIPFALVNDECISLNNATNLEEIIKIDKEAVIQDYNSQLVLQHLKKIPNNPKIPIKIWDCCAASGGKSMLAYDILKRNVQLTVSDIRLSILLNLHKRFNRAGINREYQYFVGNVAAADFRIPTENTEGQSKELKSSFDIIICDVPCSGSGTWSRTPENLFYYNPETIPNYTERQKQIVTNTLPYLKDKGLMFYITCSVLKMENEEVVNHIKEALHLKLVNKQILNGYDKRADSMFVAVFTK